MLQLCCGCCSYVVDVAAMLWYVAAMLRYVVGVQQCPVSGMTRHSERE